VLVVHDTVQANDLARHLETRHLIAPIFSGQTGFEKAGTYGVERGEFFPVREQGRSSLDFASHSDQIIEAVQVLFGQAHGHAQLAQVAIGAGDFDGLGIHGLSLGCAMDLPWIKT
jgi:hypothetical protein